MARTYKTLSSCRLNQVPSSAEYVAGLSRIQSHMSELQMQLLQQQYSAPNRSVTAPELAKLTNATSYSVVNLFYGKLGDLFCKETGLKAAKGRDNIVRWWTVWSIGYNTHQGFVWEMHSEVAEALEILGWVSSNSAISRYQQIFSELVYERDDRSPPDARRQAQFKIGWENAAMQRRTYTNKTLNSVLTWNNLGYRFGLKLGQCSNSEIQVAYDFLAQEYQINSSDSKLNITNIYPDEVASEEIFREGSVRQVSVNAYERDPKARQKCIDHYGLSCSVCSFNFGEFFGELGEGFIHVHHLRPISEIAKEYEVDPVKDLRPVCPNCHAMIHRRSPPLSIEELQVLVRNSKVQPPPTNSGGVSWVCDYKSDFSEL